MELFLQKLHLLHCRFRFIDLSTMLDGTGKKIFQFFYWIKTIGATANMDNYEKRKLRIFNQLNVLQLITGTIIPFTALLFNNLPFSQWLIAFLPALVSIAVLTLNYYEKHEYAIRAYFILFPFFTCIVYINGMNLGIELYFVLYGILSVFFIRDLVFMLFTIGFSMVSYFILSVVLKNFRYQLETINSGLYFINELLAILFIYFGLFLLKKQSTCYQLNILKKNRILHKKNLEIKKQKQELIELNALKNKLFSVIAHDLKSPMYGLRNLFHNMEIHNMPAPEIKLTIPEVVKDLNHTISLMENLLQWAKSQMEADSIKVQRVNLSSLIGEVTRPLRLQANNKQIYIERKNDVPVFVSADRDMVNVILRNLISNAIKFTPHKGKISIGINELSSFVEIYIQDTGMGISAEDLLKIGENNYHTTKGTASESGTGLGLMLCKEFLNKHGGQMFIESSIGKGSTFSFTLPRSA